MNCIYCKQEIITGSNNSVEHVFPDSFGCPDDWILDCVCRKCNNTLGGTIERWIAGDSPEAMLRLAYIGSKSGKPIKQLRLQINIPNKPEFTDFQGVRLEIDFKTGELLLPTQTGLKNNSGIYEYFTHKQLGDQKTLDRINNILSHKDIKWLASGDKNISNKKIKEFQSVLENKGINLPKGAKKEFNLPKNSIQNGKIPVNIHSLIDEDIQRAIAKIAFNYLAKIRGGNYVLKNCYDDIREFIKGNYKQNQNKLLVVPKSTPLLLKESNDKRYFGHIFTFQMTGSKITSTISLFNQGLAYDVLLTDSMSIWYPLHDGHFFDIKNKKLLPLMNTNMVWTILKYC